MTSCLFGNINYHIILWFVIIICIINICKTFLGKLQMGFLKLRQAE